MTVTVKAPEDAVSIKILYDYKQFTKSTNIYIIYPAWINGNIMIPKVTPAGSVKWWVLMAYTAVKYMYPHIHIVIAFLKCNPVFFLSVL